MVGSEETEKGLDPEQDTSEGPSDAGLVTGDDALQWYVLQTKPCTEGIVRQHLKNAKFESLLPMIRVMVRGKKAAHLRAKPLFPSYLFVHVDLADPNLYRMIKYTRGVRRILGNGIVPTALPDEVIRIIQERTGEDGIIEQRLMLKKGDAVRIRTGLFRDLVGILEKPVSAAGRIRVLLQILHHQVRCDLTAAEVERVDVAFVPDTRRAG